VVVGRGTSSARSGSGDFLGVHRGKCTIPLYVAKGENRRFVAGACVHVLLCLCRAVERGAPWTGEGVPAWLSGVWGLGALLTSSQVIRGVGAGLGKQRGKKSERGVSPLYVGSRVMDTKTQPSPSGMAGRASSNKKRRHNACWSERSSSRTDSK
jgi:hypothetical protein